MRTSAAKPRRANAHLRGIISWYFREVYGRIEGPGRLPFYCDPGRTGHFAVAPHDLASGDDHALFRLFIGMAMYQGRRNVVIMRQQRLMPRPDADSLASLAILGRLTRHSSCAYLASSEAFNSHCNVAKLLDSVDCRHRPSLPCHVKNATRLLNRTGDMGKIPTSAFLNGWNAGGLQRFFGEVLKQEPNPRKRADLLVEFFMKIHRVGRKLSTMFVSALSTPALAPGLTPWYPDVDGNALVVIDTNVARAVDVLRRPRSPRTYDARAAWLREQAVATNLQQFHPDVPIYAPRLIQQALYAFCSRSNRVVHNLSCPRSDLACRDCAPRICPFTN